MEKTVERVLSGKVSEDIIEDVAYGLVQQYGDAAASVACEFYDTLAKNAGANVPDAEAAEPAGYDDVRNVVQSRPVTESPGAVGRFVKQAAEETILQNCKRDHGEFAWVPSPGSKCAFCIMVASNGWRKIRSSDHAEHLHHNCKCEYVVRFDETTEVDGYEPEKLKEIYDNAEGTTWQEKLRSMERGIYAEKKDMANAQKRKKYVHRKVANPKKGAKMLIEMDLQFFAEKDIKKQESGSLRHAIMRYERLINEHQDKINHPEEYISNWDEYTEQHKNGLIKHWNKEIYNFQQSIRNRVDELKERGEYDERGQQKQ